MRCTLTSNEVEKILYSFKGANQRTNQLYPGELPEDLPENAQPELVQEAQVTMLDVQATNWEANPTKCNVRQPIHTVYGGAQLFKADYVKKLGQSALKVLQEFAPSPSEFASALNWPENLRPANSTQSKGSPSLMQVVYSRVTEKLTREPVEDFRIDFEDGYGNRTDSEEDSHAVFTAKEVALAFSRNELSPGIGIRIKPLTEELKKRSFRTLDLFITTLVQETKGKCPPGFVVTLPKITSVEQVSALVEILELLELKLKLNSRSLKLEFMVETPQSIFNSNGAVALPAFVQAAKGTGAFPGRESDKTRCVGVHFGTYDYTAACSITAAHQRMDHPVCDFAKNVMQVALAGTGIFLSDGATNVMPIGDRTTVHNAWRLSFQHIWHSLEGGFYQGWDLHPAQLPVRYATAYLFFMEGLEAASVRLKNFISKAAQATLVGDVFDDAATGQGLLNYFIRALNCGAITESDVLKIGLTLDEIQCRSFLKILQNRKKQL